VSSARRSQLLAVKLAALVRDHTGSNDDVVPGMWPGGAALARADAAWVLAEDQPERALGRALAWARQHRVGAVHVLAERATGLLARRASYFSAPPSIWHVEGRSLLEAVAEPFPVHSPLDAELAQFRGLIIEGGAEPFEEHGVLVGEVLGLEVCRAVRDPFTGVCRLEVGVGTHDRDAFQLLHGDIPTVEALGAVAEIVAEHRRPGAAPHPLNRLAAERALRARLINDAPLVGAARLDPAPPPVPRANLKDPVPCVAVGSDGQGQVVVVCSTGIDLDVVPFAADARAALGLPDARLVIAVPARDAVEVTVALARLLTRPAEVVGV